MDVKMSDDNPTPHQPSTTWVEDNHTSAGATTPSARQVNPTTTPAPPLVTASNSLTGISTQDPGNPPAASYRTSSSSTLQQPSSHPSQGASDAQAPHFQGSSSAAQRTLLGNPISPPDGSSRMKFQHLPSLKGIHEYSGQRGQDHSSLVSDPQHQTHGQQHTIPRQHSAGKFGNLLNGDNPNDSEGRVNGTDLARSQSYQGESYAQQTHQHITQPGQSLAAPVDYRPTKERQSLLHGKDPHLEAPHQNQMDQQLSHQAGSLDLGNKQQMQPSFAPTYNPQSQSQYLVQHSRTHQANPYRLQQSYQYASQPPAQFQTSSGYPPVFKERTYGIPGKVHNATGMQNDLPRLSGVPQIPSTRNYSHSGMRTVNSDVTPPSLRSTLSNRDSPVMNTDRPAMRTSPGGQSTVGGSLLRDTLRAFQGNSMNQERNEFLNAYTELMNAYEEKCDAIYDATDAACVDLIINSRVPYLEDTITAPVDDETPEDARQKLIVKKKFVEAMENLQGDQLPTKRRGNLPKESTAYLKKWFDEHYDHPYPSDEEKLQMSKITKIGITQISHWFINYRKRVWKPSLPANHPAHNGDSNKKQRKKAKTGTVR